MSGNKRRHDSSLEESFAEAFDSFYNDPIDFNDTYSSDDQEYADPLGSDHELASNFYDDPLEFNDRVEDGVSDDDEDGSLGDGNYLEFNDPVEGDEFNFDESDDDDTNECFISESGSDSEGNSEDWEDSDDTD
ncbi:hypothetical protein Bhyg_17594, partial [Pseudolycoriella hygida]